MYCPNCSYNNPPELRYCRNCEIDLQPDLATPQSGTLLKPLYASLPSRVLATFLDMLIMLTVAIMLAGLVMLLIAITGVDSLLYDELTLPVFAWTIAAFATAYFILMDAGSSKGTLGKRWLNLAVHDDAEMPIGLARSTLRFPLKIITLALLPLLLLQPFTSRKQALHDLLANSVVTRTTDSKKVSVMAPLLVLFMALMVPVIALTATAGMPLFQQYIQKVQLGKGVKIGHMASMGVERYYRLNGHVPASLEDTHTPVKSPLISEIEINQQNGEISLAFSNEARKNLRGKHLLFTPGMTPEQRILWKCHSTEIDTYLLPAECS